MGAIAPVFLVKGHLQSLEALEVLEAFLDKDLGEECLGKLVSNW